MIADLIRAGTLVAPKDEENVELTLEYFDISKMPWTEKEKQRSP